MDRIKPTAFALGLIAAMTGCGGGDSDSSADNTTTAPPSSPTTAGSVVFTELMVDPSRLSKLLGEWFEIQNMGARDFNLRDCVFSDAASGNFTINGDLIIVSGGGLTFSVGVAPGFSADVSYNNSGLTLDDFGDTITLTCNGVTIDSRSYTNSTSGSSSSLSSDGNGKWCDDRVNNYNGDTGTPGAVNIVCP